MISQTLSMGKIGGSVDSSLNKVIGSFGKLSAKAKEAAQEVKLLTWQQNKLGKQLVVVKKGANTYKGLDHALKQLIPDMGAVEKAQEKLSKRQKIGRSISLGLMNVYSAVASTAVKAAEMLFSCVDASAKNLDAVGKMSHSLGIASDRLQEMHIAAGHAGLSQSEFDSSIKKSTAALGQFASSGTGPAKAAMMQLGLSMDDLKSKTPSEQLDLVADALLNVKSQSERVAIANQLYGSSGVKMLEMMKGGSEGLKQAYADAAATGSIASAQQIADSAAYNDAQQKLSDTFGGLMNTVTGGLTPVMTELFLGMTNFIVKYKPFFLELFEGFEAFGKVIAPVVKVAFEGFIDVAGAVYEAFKMIKSVVLWIGEKIGGWGNLFSKVAKGLRFIRETRNAAVKEVYHALGGGTEPEPAEIDATTQASRQVVPGQSIAMPAQTATTAEIDAITQASRQVVPRQSIAVSAQTAKTAQQTAQGVTNTTNNHVTQHFSVNGQDAFNTAQTINRTTRDSLTDGGQQ